MTARPRIALVVPDLAQGGGVPAVARFVGGVLRNQGGFRVTPISLPTSSRSPLARRLAKPATWLRGPTTQQFAWEGLEASAYGANWAELEFQRFMPRRALNVELRKHDLVFVVCGSPVFAFAARDAGRPVLVQAATLVSAERKTILREGRGVAGARMRLMTRITGHYESAAMRLCDRVFVENSWMMDHARVITDPWKVVYGFPGVDACLFTPDGPQSTVDKPYILSVARWADRRKRLDLLIEAYAQLRRLLPNAPALVLAGKDAPPADAIELARRLGVDQFVKYAGAPSAVDLAALYRSAELFALSSDEEGFGVVLAESMASGTPTVSTDCGGPSSIITPGENGLLTPVGDAKALAEALARLLPDQATRRRMRRACRATVEARFSVEAAGSVFVKHCRELLGDTEPVSPVRLVTHG